MATKKQFGLGKGLAAIIPDKGARPEAEASKTKRKNEQWMQDIPTASVLPNPNQPRKTLDSESLESLVSSLKEYGLLQPIVVKEAGGGKYELIAGQRRLAAAKLAGFTKIPAIVREAKAKKSLALSLIENLQRQDLNPIDEARAYEQLRKEFFYSLDEIAQMSGKSRHMILNYLDLLQLPEEIQELIKGEQLSVTQARVILELRRQPDRAKAFAKRIIRDELSATQARHVLEDTKEETKDFKVLSTGRTVRREPIYKKDLYLREVEEKLEQKLGTKVEVEKRGPIGKVVIEFYSEEDLNSLVEKFE